jgi:hypothetical protein
MPRHLWASLIAGIVAALGAGSVVANVLALGCYSVTHPIHSFRVLLP